MRPLNEELPHLEKEFNWFFMEKEDSPGGKKNENNADLSLDFLLNIKAG